MRTKAQKSTHWQGHHPPAWLLTLPYNVFPLVWNALDKTSKRNLFYTCKGVREMALPCISSLAITLPLNHDGCHKAALMLPFPSNASSVLEKNDLRLEIRMQQGVEDVDNLRVLPASCLLRFLSEMKTKPNGKWLTYIRQLKIANAILDDALIFSLLGCVGPDQLQSLCLSGLSGYGNVPFLITPLQRFSALATLHIHISDEVKTELFDRVLQSVAQLPSLASLSFTTPNKFLLDAPDVTALAACPALTYLRLPQVTVEDEVVEVLIQELGRLTYLELDALTPDRCLKDSPCRWEKLVLHYATFWDLAHLPLREVQSLSLGPRLFYIEQQLQYIQLQDPTGLGDVQQAVDNLLACPGIPAELGLYVGSLDCLLDPGQRLYLRSLCDALRQLGPRFVGFARSVVGPHRLREDLAKSIQMYTIEVNAAQCSTSFIHQCFSTIEQFPALRMILVVVRMELNVDVAFDVHLKKIWTRRRHELRLVVSPRQHLCDASKRFISNLELRLGRRIEVVRWAKPLEQYEAELHCQVWID